MVFKNSLFLFMVVSLFMISCSKDGETNTANFQETPVDESAKLAAKELYNDYYLTSASNNNDMDWTGSEPSCDPGSIPQSVRDKILMRLMYFRKAVGLNNEIAENLTKSEKAQHAALMMYANNQLDHFPPENWKCYSVKGKDGAGNSLLAMSKNAEAIDTYIRDQGANNGPVGHRRWLLWPRLQEIGVGNTEASNALWVLGNPGNPPSDTPDFISWPPQGYVPNKLVYPRWSFSIKDADFTETQLSMKDSNGNPVTLSVEELDNAYGDRTIVWIPEGINNNSTKDELYQVTLENVKVDDESNDFEYSVILFDIDG